MMRRRRRALGGLGWYAAPSTALNGVKPSLYHDYVNNRYYDSTNGQTAFPFTAVRTTNATMFDALGRVVWSSANMVANSEAIWSTSLSAATSALQATGSPTGAAVYKLIANNAVVLAGNDGLGCATLPAVTTVLGYTYVISFYAKAAEVGIVRVREPTTTGYRALIDLTTGIVTDENGIGGLTQMLVTSQNAGNGWWRIVCRRTAAGVSQGFNVKQGNTTGDGVSGVLLSSIQFEVDDVAAPKTFTATTGVAYYGPRFDYDPVTRAGRGILVEDARTNLVLNSQQYQTGWVITNCTLSTLTTDPAGQTFGRTINETSVLSTTSLLSAAFATTASTQYSASMFLKRGNTDWVRIRCVDTTSTNGFQCWVNLATGALGTPSAIGTGTYTASTIKITALANSWYRFSMAGTIGTDISMRVSTVTASGDTSTTNISGGTYEIWGHQVELTNESSYIPTYTASVTRAIDSLIMDIPVAINQALGSWYTSIIKSTTNIASGGRIFGINDGTQNNSIEVTVAASGAAQYRTAIASVATFSPITAPSIRNTLVTRIVALVSSPTKKLVMDGGTVVTDAVILVPTSGYTKFFVGSSLGLSSAHMGWIQEIRYYPSASASNGQLQTLST